MKLLSATQGVLVNRLPADDFTPANGIPVSDLEKVLTETYGATRYSMPQLQQMPAGVSLPGVPALWMQGGHLELSRTKVPIQHILIFQNGLWVSTPSTTENANAVFQHLVKKLEGEFGFRLTSDAKEEYWTSNVVVEFGKPMEKLARDLEILVGIVNKAIGAPSRVLQFKRLALGYDGHDEAVNTYDTIEWTDFSIERRVKTPYSLNRFFSASPTPTTKHLEILETIESELSR